MVEVRVYRRHSSECPHKKCTESSGCACRTEKGKKQACDCKCWITWNKDGKQVQQSAKTRTWTVASDRAHQIESGFRDAELGRAPEPGSVKVYTVKEAIDRFLLNKRAGGKHGPLAPDSIYRYEHVLNQLLDFCNRNAVVFVRDITADHLEAWLTSEVWASLKSLHARRSHGEKVRNFFRFCVRKLGLATVPHMDSVVVKNHAEAVRPFDKKEYERIIAAIAKTSMTDENKTRIKAIMQLQRFSGLSLIDAVMLSKDQLQLRDGEYHVVRQRQKTKHAGITVNNVIPTWLGEELLRVKNGNPKYFFWSGTTTPEDAPSYFQKLYRRVFETAGIDGSSHDFRHTYAVELLKAGVNIRSVQKALGHASLQVTERFYAKWNQAQQSMLDDELRAALAKQK